MARRTGVVLIAIAALAAATLALATGGTGVGVGPHSAGGPPDPITLSSAAVTGSLDASPGGGEVDARFPPAPTASAAVMENAVQTIAHVPSGVLEVPMDYPVEKEPDGNRWLPHHGLWPLPLYVIGWYLWHPAGAPVLGATVVGLAVLLLLDDWLSHAFGLRTPGDVAFHWLMSQRSFRRMYIRLWWIVYR